MELKTLKDLEIGEDKEHLFLLENLKAEVVKWYHRSDSNKHKFIMEFFNLTEEEISGEKG